MRDPDEKHVVHIGMGFFCWLGTKTILMRNGMSFQEFFSYIAYLLATGDNRVHALIQEAKDQKAAKQITNLVHTDEESLYAVIEATRDANSRSKEEG